MNKKILFLLFVITVNISVFSQMTKIEVAEYIYDQLYDNNSPDSYEASEFPNPFYDLPDNTTLTKKIKLLSYLEYDDEKTCFFRDGGFSGNYNIQRIFTLVYIMEAWNIPTAYSSTSPYPDVETNMAYYEYVVGAHNAGIIGGSYFRPWDIVTNDELLYDFMTGIFNSSYYPVSEITLQDMDNYFSPNNYTPYNFGVNRGLEQGVFSHYAKNSFVIQDVKLNLNFSHYYSNSMVEIDDSFFPIEPLGRGWSHTYNAYVVREIIDDDIIFTIKWADGTIHIWNDTDLEYITKGVYNGFTYADGSDELHIRMKDQTKYTFEIIGNDLDIFYLIEIEDKNDNRIQIGYESADEQDKERILYVEAPSGKRLEFDYFGGSDLLRKIFDPIDRDIEFSYDQGRLKEFYDAKGNETVYYYLANDGSGSNNIEHFLLDRIKLPRGNSIYAEYDNDEKLSKYRINTSDEYLINVQFNFGNGNDEVVSDVTVPMPDGGTQNFHYEYNENGVITQFQNDTDDISFTYNAPENININRPSNINKNGLDIDYEYDDDGNVKKITTEGDLEERFWYNSDNNITKYRDANGHDTRFYYEDDDENLTRIKDALGNNSTFTYDDHGQMLTSTNQEGITITYTYEDDGAVETITAPENMSASFSYDDINRMLSKNINGQSSSYTYDDNDNLETHTNIGGFTTTFDYDDNDNVATITNSHGVETEFEYNNEDQVIEEKFGSLIKQYDYNDDGTLKEYIKPSGNDIDYDYDDEGRLIETGTITDIDYYSDNGLLKRIYNDNGHYRYYYDDYNRVEKVKDNFNGGDEIEYDYDDVGNITEIIYPNNASDFKVIYVYDAKNRMIEIKTDINGNLETKVQYSYRDDDKLSEIDYLSNDNFYINKNYDYDDIGRLTTIDFNKVPVGGGTATELYREELDINNRGNILSDDKYYAIDEPDYELNQETQTYNFDNNNQIIQAGTTNYNVDDDGNTTQKGSLNLNYDIDDRLTSITGNNGTTTVNIEHKYDAYGNRIEKNIIAGTTNPETRKYVWDVMNNNIIKEYNPNGSEQFFYVYGASGLEFVFDPNTGNIEKFYHGDVRGSVVFATDTNADVIDNKFNKYDDFGNIITANSADTEEYGGFYYLGKHGIINDVTAYTGLYQIKARYYDAKLGRFITQDPIWSTNLYPYSGNNPIGNIDVNGENSIQLYGSSEFQNALSYESNKSINIFKKATSLPQEDFQYSIEEINQMIEFYTFVAEGRYIGTGIVENANNYYGDLYTQNYLNGESTLMSSIGIGFTSLWTPSTYQKTLDAFTLKRAVLNAPKYTTILIGKTGVLGLVDMRKILGLSLKELSQYLAIYGKIH